MTPDSDGRFPFLPPLTLRPIAYIENDFPTKFGIPRQSGLSPELEAVIRPLPPYDDPSAYRGIGEYSHLWLLWGFSEVERERERERSGSASRPDWRPTVRPPRLGGNRRVGVFATRSPYRPNPVGLSSVRLLGVEKGEKGKGGILLRVAGADLMNGTPIYDIKPYLSFTDSHQNVRNGFAEETGGDRLRVELPEKLHGSLPEEKEKALLHILASDPRPGYQEDPERIYGFPFAGREIRFRVSEGTVRVLSIMPLSDKYGSSDEPELS